MLNKDATQLELPPGSDLEVAIIGAGFSGLGMAYKLRKSGETNFLIFERESEIGGTWQSARYPGAGCDIPSNLYSYSYAPNKNWTRKFARQQEINRYINDCAKSFGVLPHIRLEHELINAKWDSSSSRWCLETSKGSYTAKALISATGYLSEPKYPDISGLESFEGTLLHTANWDQEIELTGKRVAVIGTGASTIQLVPAIQPLVEQLTVFQRSAGWVVPKHDKVYKGWSRWAMRNIPGYQRVVRRINYWISESHIWFMKNPKRMGIPQKEARDYLEKSVTDPVLREKLRPEHVVGCKRYLFSDDYYPALQQPNVAVETQGIAAIDAQGIITNDGVKHTADVIVMATGYNATKLQFAERITGAHGRSLSEVWSRGQFAYLGMSIPQFPNYFTLMGPNSTVVHTSAILMSELQVDYILNALRHCLLTEIDVQPDIVDGYNSEVQDAIQVGIWNAGCQSWYIDENGKNTAVWPFSIANFRKRSMFFNMSDYATTEKKTQSIHIVFDK
ncbi:MAG: NAD(P)/FAD-dependent oxidoreductase [Granulosicoccus sp.]|nr:NAD(P)/FAD-dependent oxidoreductase [Granulosicoccus sp.]